MPAGPTDVGRDGIVTLTSGLKRPYARRYNNDYWGPATVSERVGRLVLALGPRGNTVDLTH
jgi:hypothetical protein